jgi:hypothetical protein
MRYVLEMVCFPSFFFFPHLFPYSILPRPSSLTFARHSHPPNHPTT